MRLHLATALAAFLLLPRTAQAQTFTFNESSIPPDGLVYYAECDGPTNDMSGQPVDPTRMAFTMNVDGGATVPDTAQCKFTITVKTAGNHSVNFYTRYKQTDGTFKTSQPLMSTLQIILTTETLPMPPTNARIIRAAGTTGGPQSAPFALAGHGYSLSDTDGAPNPESKKGDVNRDGIRIGGPATDLQLYNGKVYALANGTWWLYTEPLTWSDAGTEAAPPWKP